MRRNCEAGITITAPPEAVWEVISDVTRVGEWSGECRECEWIGDVGALAVGDRFRGRNRRGGMRWSRVNEVVVADRPHSLVWRTVPRFPYPDAVEWRLRLEDDAAGTRVSESFAVRSIPRIMEWALWVVMPAHRDRTGDLADDLARLKMVVERSGDDGP